MSCVLLAAMPAVASAQDAGARPRPDVPREAPALEGVVDTLDVVADRPDPLETLSTFATVHKIEPHAVVTSVAEIVESGVGTHVRRYGGLGSYAAASVRASSPGQVEVYLDGVPLMSDQWGATNLSDLPVSHLDRIEVYRGGSPVDFGTPGVGGLVNLVTATTTSSTGLAAVSAGSHGTWKVDLQRSGIVRSVGLLASFSHLESEGDYEYLDRRGTPENPDDDEVVERENNSFRQSDLLVRAELPRWFGWRLELADNAFRKESGVPGIENVRVRSVHYEVLRNIARVSVISPYFIGAVQLRATGFHQYRRDLFFNPDDEVGFNRSDTDDVGLSYGANALTTLHWHAARQALSLFAETRRERFTPEDKNPAIGVGFTRERSSLSLSVEDKLFLGASVQVTAGYRLRESVDNFSGPVPFGQPPSPLTDPHWTTHHGPSFGLRWEPHPAVMLRANTTRYARFPSMGELFGAQGTVIGNPELTPEEGSTRDVGLTLHAGRDGAGHGGAARAEIVLFRVDRENLITFLENSPTTVKAFNMESARVEGIELSISGQWGRSSSSLGMARVTATYTDQDARNTGPSPVYNGKRVPYEPRHSLFVRTSWTRGRARLWHDYRFESDAYRDRANLPENLSPSRQLHDLGISVEIIDGLVTVSGEVSNVTDERAADVEGFPLPGRTYMIGLQFASEKEGRR
jgi:iron complex outermembrane receptor protein